MVPKTILNHPPYTESFFLCIKTVLRKTFQVGRQSSSRDVLNKFHLKQSEPSFTSSFLLDFICHFNLNEFQTRHNRNAPRESSEEKTKVRHVVR